MKETEICFSNIPELQEFVAPQSRLDPSPMNVMAEGLLKVQMDLSRLIMLGDCCLDERQSGYVRSAMDYVATIYDNFCKIEEGRLAYMRSQAPSE